MKKLALIALALTAFVGTAHADNRLKPPSNDVSPVEFEKQCAAQKGTYAKKNNVQLCAGEWTNDPKAKDTIVLVGLEIHPTLTNKMQTVRLPKDASPPDALLAAAQALDSAGLDVRFSNTLPEKCLESRASLQNCYVSGAGRTRVLAYDGQRLVADVELTANRMDFFVIMIISQPKPQTI